VRDAVEGPGGDGEVLVSGHRIDVRRHDFRTLRDGAWLNDEVINIFSALLGAWKDAPRSLCPRAYMPNSFFLTSLLGGPGGSYDYSRVQRWTSRAKTDVFACESVIIPRNVGKTHWTCVWVDVPGRTVMHLDSLGASGRDACEAVVRWLCDEHADKKKAAMEPSDWAIRGPPSDLPRQDNGSDCGVFVCAFMWHLVQGFVPTKRDFGPRDMPGMRRALAAAILRQSATLQEEGEG
jgi:sentrin-specific protease 1